MPTSTGRGPMPTSTGRGPMPTSTGRGPVPISFPAEGLPTGATALALVPTELLGFVTKYVGACFRCNVLLFVFDGNANLFLILRVFFFFKFRIGLDQFFLFLLYNTYATAIDTIIMRIANITT